MLKKIKNYLKNKWLNSRAFLVATIGKGCVNLLMFTCRVKINGIERFRKIAETEKCILMLWHNRLVITPWILSYTAPQFNYAAVVSNSRDGEMISRIVESYKARTILVPHNKRYEALQTLINCINKKRQIIVITPDGPRGPCYELKSGVAVAALETNAFVIPLNWKASRYWEFGTWDRLRLPKPFSTIEVEFGEPIQFNEAPPISLDDAKKILQKALFL